VYDADEYELVQLSTYLRVDSDADDGDDEEEDNEKENELSSTTLASYSHSDNSTDIIYATAAAADTTTRSGRNSLTKVKRKQWTIREKLKAISTFNDNNNKYQTCKIYGCTPNQLRQWLSVEDQLKIISKEKLGLLVQHELVLNKLQWIIIKKFTF